MIDHSSLLIDDQQTQDARYAADLVMRKIYAHPYAEPERFEGEDPLVSLGFSLGEDITYEAGVTMLAAAAVEAAEDSKRFWVMARQGQGPEMIMGRYRTALEANAVAEARQRADRTGATFYVEDQQSS